MATNPSQAPALKYVLDRRFRSNPAYKVVLYDRLTTEQRAALPGLQDSRSLFGVLVPNDDSLGLKSVSRDAALLFYALADPGPLPSFVREMFGARPDEAIAHLVLDGVLEVEHDGQFVSGAAAQSAIADPIEVAGSSALARLSIEAIQHGQALRELDALALAARLYAYNRQPVSPYWTQKYPSPASLAEYLDSQGNASVRRWLQRAWTSPPSSSTDVHWRYFRSRYMDEGTGRLRFKLYLSPHVQELGESFAAFVAVLSEERAPFFKVGRLVAEVLRPDKMVAYFESFEALHAAADKLGRRIEGVQSHGVPFTAELSGDGLISWGIDPPELAQVLAWQRQTSWRRWISQRLAVSLVAARNEAVGIEPWRFALQRLQLDGVEPSSFAPSTSMWIASPFEPAEAR